MKSPESDAHTLFPPGGYKGSSVFRIRHNLLTWEEKIMELLQIKPLLFLFKRIADQSERVIMSVIWASSGSRLLEKSGDIRKKIMRTVILTPKGRVGALIF